jgi:hypothetical protein
VAYLDGELPPEECRRVEERLASDADYRQQLRDLDQAWEALESLPSTNADDNFARTTIEMVTVAAEREVSDRAAAIAAVNRKRYWGWALAGIATAAVGFAAARMLLPSANRELLNNLPVIYQFDRLSQVEDVGIAFLRGLPSTVSLDQLARDQVAVNRDLADLRSIAASTPQSRREWVENLSPEQKNTLAAQFARFEERSPGEQKKLRDLEQAIRQAPDAEQLQKSLIAYDHWLSRRSSAEQEDLRAMPTDERLREIEFTVQRDDERAAAHLSAEDARKLREEIYEIYEDRRWDYERQWRRDPDTLPRLDGPMPMRAIMVLQWELRNDNRDDRTRERLIEQLSAEAQKTWNEIGERDRGRRWFLLSWWIREAMQPKWGPEELEKFFAQELDNTERERLLSMDTDEMQAHLERLYLAHKFGLRGSEGWFGGFGPRGGGMPPGPPPGRGGPDRERDGRRRNRERREGPRPDGPPRGGFEAGRPGDSSRDRLAEPPAEDRPEREPQPETPPANTAPPKSPEAPGTG